MSEDIFLAIMSIVGTLFGCCLVLFLRHLGVV